MTVRPRSPCKNGLVACWHEPKWLACKRALESICKGTFAVGAGGREVSWASKLAIAIAVVVGSALSGIALSI